MRYLLLCSLLTFAAACPGPHAGDKGNKTVKGNSVDGDNLLDGGGKIILSLSKDLVMPESSALLTYANESEFARALSASNIMENDPQQATTMGAPSPTADDNSEKDPCPWTGKVQAAGERLWFSVDADMTECLQDAYNKENDENFSQKILAMTFQLSVDMTCVGKDLSGLNGKDVNDVASASNPCEGASGGSMTLLTKSHTAIETNSKLADRTYTVTHDSTTMGATIKENGGACTWVLDGGFERVDDGCMEVELTRFDKDQDYEGKPTAKNGKSAYTKLLYKGIVRKDLKDRGLYGQAGSYEMILGNWQGSVTYQGVDASPTYSFSNGAQKAEGKVWDLGQAMYLAKSKATKQHKLENVRNKFKKAWFRP